MKSNSLFLRDGNPLSYEEWNKKVEEDLNEENKTSAYCSSIYSV